MQFFGGWQPTRAAASPEHDKGNRMIFLDCPAYLDDEGTARCGLPAEVQCRFTMHSTDGPLESVMIRCPSRHWFNAPAEFLMLDNGGSQRMERPEPAARLPGRG